MSAGRAQAARIVHLGLTAGTIVIAGGLAVLRQRAGPTPLPDVAETVLRAIVLALVVGATLGIRLLRGALGAPPRAGDPDAWWAANQGRAVALWSLAEGVGVAGSALFFVGGDPFVLAVALAWALAMLLWYAPGRLVE